MNSSSPLPLAFIGCRLSREGLVGLPALSGAGTVALVPEPGDQHREHDGRPLAIANLALSEHPVVSLPDDVV